MTLQRILTAAVLIPIVAAIVWWGPLWLVALVVGLVILFALYEFFRLGACASLRGYPRWTTLCALAIVLAQWAAVGVQTQSLGTGLSLVRVRDVPAVPLDLVLLVYVLGLAALALAGRRNVPDILPGVAISAAGMLLVALPFSYLVRLDGFESQGPQLLLFLLVLIWVGDTCAYFVGRFLGRVPMAPVLSPKKTWEGAAANLAGSVVVGVVFTRWLLLPAAAVIVVAALSNIAGQLGDLIESAYKRSAGAKDSGLLLPGHGGMLDRIDSLIFAAPVAWWYLCWVTHAGCVGWLR